MPITELFLNNDTQSSYSPKFGANPRVPIEKIKNKANMLEKEALKHERMLIHMKNGALGLETSEQVNSLIISSIKAKLALLEKFQNS